PLAPGGGRILAAPDRPRPRMGQAGGGRPGAMPGDVRRAPLSRRRNCGAVTRPPDSSPRGRHEQHGRPATNRCTRATTTGANYRGTPATAGRPDRHSAPGYEVVPAVAAGNPTATAWPN